MTMTDMQMEPGEMMELPEPVGQEQQEPALLEYLQTIIGANNIVDEIEETVLNKMAMQVLDDYEADKDSMSDWFGKIEKGLDLARMVKADKTYPFEGASNIKWPLITQAALEYNARTYPAIVPSGDPIACKVNGSDPSGAKASRAERTASYTAYQLKEEMDNWDGDCDRLTFIGPIVGTMFRKVWYDPAIDQNQSRLCTVGKVIVNHNITSLSQAPAITEELDLYQHEIETRIRTNMWSDKRDKMALPEDERSKPVEFLEQHMRFDLDDDGYAEPYIVTIHKDSRTIVRIVANFTLDDVMLDEDQTQILTVKPSSYFIDYTFLPALDGGFFGDGFGVLLSDISETINTSLNMLMDAGHYQSMPSGFIGAKDMRIKGGNNRFAPGEWRNLDARGQDIRTAMVPFQMPAPSPILFQMIGLLNDAGRQIGSSKDIAPEQASQMTATTTMALVEQNQRVFNASFKRVYRSMKREYKMLFKLNERYLTSEKYSAFFDDENEQGPIMYDPREEFSLKGMDIAPAADPQSVTDTQRMGRAQFLMELAQGGMVDMAAATTRVLEAAHIEDIEELIPQPTQEDAAMAEMQKMNIQLDLKMKAAKIDLDMANAVKAIAQAEGEEVGQQLQDYMTGLQAMKMEYEVGQQRLQAMAGGPNNGGNPASDAQAAPQGGGSGQGGMVGG